MIEDLCGPPHFQLFPHFDRCDVPKFKRCHGVGCATYEDHPGSENLYAAKDDQVVTPRTPEDDFAV